MRPISFRPSLELLCAGVAMLASLPAHADVSDILNTRTMTAVIRQGKNLVQQNVQLTDLTSNTGFQGSYFTVVDGMSNDPIPFNAPGDLALRAATVYYAFAQSRSYFVQTLSSLVPTLPVAQQSFLNQPMVIRLNMNHPFSPEIHYDLHTTVYNGAVTIPPSDEFKDDNIPAWGAETWFFTAQSQKVVNPAAQIPALLNSSDFKLGLFEQLADEDAVQSIQNLEIQEFSWQVLGENVGISLALAEGVPPIMSKIIEVIPGYVYLDAAFIPEIAANEYAHYALYPWLDLKQRFPVGEGYAHYFAAKVTGLVELQNNAGPYSKGYSPIKGDSSEMYSFAKEVGATAAMSSFTFSVLEDLDSGLGSDGLPVIVGTIPYLNSSSNLAMDFERAVFGSISDLGLATGRDLTNATLEAHAILANRGM